MIPFKDDCSHSSNKPMTVWFIKTMTVWFKKLARITREPDLSCCSRYLNVEDTERSSHRLHHVSTKALNTSFQLVCKQVYV